MTFDNKIGGASNSKSLLPECACLFCWDSRDLESRLLDAQVLLVVREKMNKTDSKDVINTMNIKINVKLFH